MGFGDLLGVGTWVDAAGLRLLLARLAFDLLFTSLAVHWIYLPRYRNRQHALTCYVFNVVTLSQCVLLRRGPAELGFALALFGVFGILRYRTEQIKSRDLTYLFLVIGLGIINGVADRQLSVAELVLTNAAIVGSAAALELSRRRGVERATPMCYDRLDLLHPGRERELAADLLTRTGLVVVRVDTERIDLLRDAADITIHSRS